MIIADISQLNIHESGLFTSEIKCSNESTSSLVNQTIEVQLLGEEISTAEKDGNDVVLVFKITFAPSKAFQ